MGSTQEPFQRSRSLLRSESCPLLWQLQEFLSWMFFYLGWKQKRDASKIDSFTGGLHSRACGREYSSSVFILPGRVRRVTLFLFFSFFTCFAFFVMISFFPSIILFLTHDPSTVYLHCVLGWACLSITSIRILLNILLHPYFLLYINSNL